MNPHFVLPFSKIVIRKIISLLFINTGSKFLSTKKGMHCDSAVPCSSLNSIRKEIIFSPHHKSVEIRFIWDQVRCTFPKICRPYYRLLYKVLSNGSRKKFFLSMRQKWWDIFYVGVSRDETFRKRDFICFYNSSLFISLGTVNGSLKRGRLTRVFSLPLSMSIKKFWNICRVFFQNVHLFIPHSVREL